MVGSLVGAAMKIGGTIFGGISASKAMKRVKANLESQKAANQAWFDRRYNEDATQRADAQRILTKTEDSIRERNRQAAGTVAVMGGTEESVAAAKAANNEAMAESASRIAVAGDARKDNIESQYHQREAQIVGQLNNMETAKADQIRQAAVAMGNTGANIAGSF